jgi:predicted metal-dependent enzyme (double-stranded beta helix superfamily)
LKSKEPNCVYRERERKRDKTEREKKVFVPNKIKVFSPKKMNSRQKVNTKI